MLIKYGVFVLMWASLSFCEDVLSAIKPILGRARQLAFEHIQDRSKPVPVVAIAGCSAVGKTYFANTLALALRQHGVNVFVLHQDDYLDEDRIFPGYKIHPNLDHESMHTFLAQNRAGMKEIIKPCLIDRKYFKKKKVHLVQVDLIIFEGIYSLTGPETYNFSQYSSVGIFLDAQTSNIITWHASRNKKRPFFRRLGNSDIQQHATCLLYEYTRFILPSKGNAQFVVFKDGLNSYSLISS